MLRSKRWLSFMLAFVMLFSALPLNAQAEEIKTVDVDVTTKAGQVEYVADTTHQETHELHAAAQVLTEGTDDIPVTRAQWLQLLVETFDYVIDGDIVPDNYFPDLSAEAEYYDAVLTAVYYGLVDVLPNSELRPDEAVTREFAAYTLNACMGYLPDAAEYEFSEADSVTYADDIQVAIERGWFALTDGAFLPEQVITQEERDGMLADAQSYIDDMAIDQSHDNQYTFKEGIIVIEDVAQILPEENGSLIVIPELTQALAVGDRFVVFQDGLAIPYEAAAVTVVDGQTQISAVDLYFQDAIETMNVQLETDTDVANFYAAEDAELIFIEESTGQEYSQQAAIQAVAKGSKAIYIPKYSKSFEIGSGVTVSLNVELKNAKLCHKVDIGFAKGSASVWLDTDADVSAKLSCSLADMVGDGFEVYIGGYEVPGVGGLAVYVKMDVSGSITVVKKLHMKVGVKVGFDALKWKATTGKIFKVTDKGSTMNAEISAKICLEAKFGVYGKSLPLKGYLYGEAGFKANVKYTEYSQIIGTCTHFAAFLYAEYGAKIEWGILGYQNSIDWNKEMIKEENSPVKISLHYEDGKQVNQCTRTDLEGTTSGTPSKIGDSGYTTSPGSSYSGSGLSRGSSTGSSASGEPIIIYEYTLDDADYATITRYRGNASSLSVPSTIDGYPVVAIGSGAFEGCTGLTSVILPDSVTQIGSGAFRNCSSLSRIELPSKLEFLDEGAFANCRTLSYIKIPKTLTRAYAWNGRASDGIFYGCTKLKTVTLEKGMTIVAPYLFCGAPAIETITIPDTVTEIGAYAFAHAGGLKNIVIPDSVLTISNHAFLDCTALERVTFSQNLTALNTSAFEGCTVLGKVELPDSLKEIQDAVFKGCTNLSQVKLPAALEFLNEGAFINCTSLTEITIPKTLTRAYAWNGRASDGIFYGCTKLKTVTLEEGMTIVAPYLFCGAPAIETITIPDTVTEIGAYAFAHAGGLKNIVIPDSVLTISNHAFLDCTALERVTFSQNLTALSTSAFEGCTVLGKVELPDSLKEIQDAVFRGCTNLAQVKLPTALEFLNEGAFINCTSLTEITIPKTLTRAYAWNGRASDGIFYGCTALTNVTLEEGMTIVAPYLFCGAPAIETITIPDTVTEIGAYAFAHAVGLKNIVIPDSVLTINSYAFLDCTGLEAVQLPQQLTSLGSHAFENCSSLQQITVSEGVATIGESTFAGCAAMTAAVLPDSVTLIGEAAFRNCAALAQMTFSDNLKTIDEYAFQDCGLTQLQLPETLTRINRNAFSNNDFLTEVVLPNGVTYLGTYCFSDCDVLERVVVPNSVTKMETYCFNSCDLLTDVTLGLGLTEIPSYAFANCAELEQIVIPYYVTKINSNAFKSSAKLTKVVVREKLASIGTEAFSYPAKTVFYGPVGSYAETWCADNGFKFNENTTAATSVTVAEKTISLPKGQSKLLDITVAPVDFSDSIVFKSSNTAVATVDETGKLIAVAPGTTTIKIIVGDASASCKVTVTQAVTKITLNKSKLALDVPDTYQLTATINPADASNQILSWTSSNESAATVDENGLITAVGNGTAVITAAATDGSGVSASCTVTVTDPFNIPVESITLSSDALSIEALEAVQLTATVKPDDAANKTLIWSSSDESVATVDADGIVTGVKKGTATITAAAADESGVSAACTVTVTNNAHVVTDVAQLESTHNYSASCTDFWLYTVPHAEALYVTFDPNTELEEDFDFLLIFSGSGELVGSYTGTALAGQTVTVPGDTVKIQLNTDDSGNEWGFKVTEITVKEHTHDYVDGVCTICGHILAQTVATGWSGATEWTLTSDGTLTVYGSGNMKNYGYAGGQPWLNKGVDITSVVIEEGVTSVGSGAFMDLTTLESVVLPETLTKMGEAAFYGSGLTSVEIPASLWTIQPYTFKNCVNLAEVTFNEGNLQKISDGAFYGTGLTELVLPDCLDILDVYAFKGCADLTDITIGAGLTELREAVFYGTAIPSITIPEGITKIGPYAFKNCVALETVDFPSTLTSVGEASFYADTALRVVELPDAVTSIGNYAFRKCAAIETLTLSAELVTIGECAFYGCTGLTELVIPDKVTTIKPYAFKTCEGLTSVVLGESVQTIGEGAFNTCTGLKTIVFPASLESIGDYCFSGSYNLWKLTFEGDAPAIGTGAFKGLNATAYYPGDNATWTSAVMQNYGGKLTWKAN